MPNRLIKESICTSDKINSLNDFHFRLWTCLIVYVDDFGRGDARPAIIKGRCFPLRDSITTKDIEKGLQILADAGCITLYRVNKLPYLCFPNWIKHQSIRNQKSKYPGLEEADAEEPQTVESNCMQLNSIDCKCSRNPIQSESKSNPNPNPNAAGADLFARFWMEYPRKEAKQAAIKAFEKLKPDEALLEIMLSAIRKSKESAQWQESGGQFIPHPATWLNQRRWEDEPPKPQTATRKPRKDDYEQRPNTEHTMNDVPEWIKRYKEKKGIADAQNGISS